LTIQHTVYCQPQPIGDIMIKTPGRKPQSPMPSSTKKKQLSNDAKIISALIKKQPQTKDEICKETKIEERTFYRVISFLEEQKIVKCEDHFYAMWDFNPLEKQIEVAFFKLQEEFPIVNYNDLIDEIGKPWNEIEAITLKVAKKLGLTRSVESNGINFTKMSQLD
jgi:hypothetical protein